MSEFYIKEGRKYVKVGYETPRFLSDGVWIVQKGGDSCQCIMKVGELSEVFPFANMVGNAEEDLALYIRYENLKGLNAQLDVKPDGTVTYHIPSAHDESMKILKFLALSKKARKAKLEELKGQTLELDFDGDVRDANGMAVYRAFSKEALLFAKKKKQEELAQINKWLKQ